MHTFTCAHAQTRTHMCAYSHTHVSSDFDPLLLRHEKAAGVCRQADAGIPAGPSVRSPWCPLYGPDEPNKSMQTWMSNP